jgi:hypothetical protein
MARRTATVAEKSGNYTVSPDRNNDPRSVKRRLAVGNDTHTFREVSGAKTMFVQLDSQIDACACSFAATSQGTQTRMSRSP